MRLSLIIATLVGLVVSKDSQLSKVTPEMCTQKATDFQEKCSAELSQNPVAQHPILNDGTDLVCVNCGREMWFDITREHCSSKTVYVLLTRFIWISTCKGDQFTGTTYFNRKNSDAKFLRSNGIWTHAKYAVNNFADIVIQWPGEKHRYILQKSTFGRYKIRFHSKNGRRYARDPRIHCHYWMGIDHNDKIRYNQHN